VPDISADGNIRVQFVVSIASKAAPTAAELNGGLRLDAVASAAGLIGWEPETASVNNRKLSSTFNSSDVGSVSIDESTIEFFKQSGTDTIYTTLVKLTVGFIVIRRSIAAATTFSASQLLQGVYPVRCGQRTWVGVEQDTNERWRMPFKITDEPAFDAVVA
jgi:hypothetical protein